MAKFLLRRILGSIPVIFVIITLVFFLVRLAPGDPMDFFVGPTFTPEVRELMRVKYGLDRHVVIQYFSWLANIFTGDFGFSIRQNRPVFEIISQSFMNTIWLTLAAMIIDFTLGILVGVLSAIRKYSIFDMVATTLCFVIYSTPTFLLALLAIYLFAFQLDWFPSSGMATIGLGEPESFWDAFTDRVHHIILPALVLGIGSAASTARYMRGSLLETISQDYIRTARAKGAGEIVVVFRHALRNALIPIVTLFGLSLPFLFSGAAITEIVFAWPGMGRVFLDSALQRDYPVSTALSIVVATMVVFGNLISDVLYAVVDPRIKYS